MRAWVQPSGVRVLGIVLVFHGLAHGVLPLRGAGMLGADPWVNGLASGCSAIALIGFVTAGMGALGVRPFDRLAWWIALVAAVSSMIAFRMLGDTELWPGMLLDLLLGVSASVVGVERLSPKQLSRTGSGIARRVWQTGGVLFVAYVAASVLLWPWHRSWGTTADERAIALPGDPAYRHLAFELMHGVTIDAPPAAVWPWLVQIGQDRAGFYSYDWLERLFLADIRNVNEIRPEWQIRVAGDFVPATQRGYLGGVLGDDLGWFVTEVQPGRALVLQHWGAFVLLDDGRGGTRLLVRSRFSAPDIPVWAAAVSFTAFELPHFIMERRMLLGIKERVERSRARAIVFGSLDTTGFFFPRTAKIFSRDA